MTKAELRALADAAASAKPITRIPTGVQALDPEELQRLQKRRFPKWQKVQVETDFECEQRAEKRAQQAYEDRYHRIFG